MLNLVNKILLIIVFILTSLLLYKILVLSNNKSTQSNKAFDIKEKEQVQSIIKEYIMHNPQVLLESIEQFQLNKLAESEKKINKYISEKRQDLENINSPYLGNIKGDITIISFYDYNCDHCKKGQEYLYQVLSSNERIKVVLKPLPILGDSSIYAAKIVFVIYKIAPEKLLCIHSKLMQLNSIEKDEIKTLLSENGLDVEYINAEIEKEYVQTFIDNNFEIAENLMIKGVPYYIVNGHVLPNGNFDYLQQLIASTREKI